MSIASVMICDVLLIIYEAGMGRPETVDNLRILEIFTEEHKYHVYHMYTANVTKCLIYYFPVNTSQIITDGTFI